MSEVISREEFAKIASKPSIALVAYYYCPVCCSSSFDICVSTIDKGECRRYEDLKFKLSSLGKLKSSEAAKQ